MKKALVAILLTTVVGFTACNKQKKAGNNASDQTMKLETEEQRYSYALGYQFGANINQLGVELNQDAIIKAIRDGLDGKEGQLNPTDLQQAMISLRNKRVAVQKERADKSQQEGQNFLDENKSKEGIQVTESGLQYLVLEEGTGAKPTAKDRVKVHYKGTLIDGTQFDSSYDRGAPAVFGVDGVIQGWTEALQLMKEGAKWRLFIPSDLAYGEVDRPSIPGNSVLLFDVELIEIVKDEAKPKK